jgi:hypothetical protein
LGGINDDIVEGVITQLQKTANRPHLVKELAAILSTSVKIVETSVLPLHNVMASIQALTILKIRESISNYLFATIDIFKVTMLDGACAVSHRQGAGDGTSLADVLLPHHISASTYSRPGASNNGNHYFALVIISGVAIG